MNKTIDIFRLDDFGELITDEMGLTIKYSFLPQDDSYTLRVNAALFDRYEDILDDSKGIIEHIQEVEEMDNNYSKQYDIAEKEIESVLKDTEYVTFSLEPEDAFEFIQKSPILKTKKYIFKEDVSFNLEKISKYESLFEDTSKLYFQIPGNFNLISFDEYKTTVQIINGIVDDVKSYNYSPLEMVVHVYDIVRDKVYNKEDEGENPSVSRNLSSSLIGDKIVCVGFAVIFNTILSKLGFSCREQLLFKNGDEPGGHDRSEVYIKDDKYDVEGVYFFDPTWDSKEKENDNSFLESYKCFARTKQVFDRMDNLGLNDINLTYPIENIAEDFAKMTEILPLAEIDGGLFDTLDNMSRLVYHNPFYRKGIAAMTNNFTASPEEIARIIMKTKVFDSVSDNLKALATKGMSTTKEEIIKKAERLEKLYNNPIPVRKLIKLISNVRKKQYYRHAEKYPYTQDTIKNIYLKSGWKLPKDELLSYGDNSPEYRLLSDIFGIESSLEGVTSESIIEDFLSEKEIDRDIERVRLTKTLSEISKKSK